MTNDTTLRRRSDGSIDTDHFVQKGRTERGYAAKHAITKIIGRSHNLATTLAGLLVMFLPHAGH